MYSVTIATVAVVTVMVVVDKNAMAVDKVITRKISATASVESSWATTKSQTVFAYKNKKLMRAIQINVFNVPNLVRLDFHL